MTEEMEAVEGEYKELAHTFSDVFTGKEVTVSVRFKRPGVQSANRAQKGMMKSPSAAFRTLCVDAVHPEDKQKMGEAFDRFPGLASTFGNELLKALGFGELGN